MQLGGPGFDIVEKARDAIVRHRMFEKGDTIVVALSGGPDSSCLLDVLDRLTDTFELDLAVAHVDHGLAEGSADVSAGVTTRAAESGHDVHFVRAPDLEGPNLQARARNFRYGFLETIAENVGASGIATGHTLDDRIETTLARLLHGAGTRGVAGLLPVDGNRVRPLATVRRSEARAYCVERDIEFVDDPANEDDRFERVAIRKRLIPVIEERWGRGAVDAIATSSERLLEDAVTLDGLADTLFIQLSKRIEAGIQFERAALNGVPRAFRRRLLERSVGRVRDRSAGIDEVLDALDKSVSSSGSFSIAGGGEIALSPEAVLVRPPSDGVSEGPTTIDR
ncbi:MAG: tRNA lysidine(34) synthetase TilS [Actinomycetota bacterium]|nr:tRNA lysidine(34) synthetase TilS [Actinomycetota bacterium]